MPSRCVVLGCSNVPDPAKGIGLHTIPYPNDDRPEARKRREKWVDFVRAKRAKWEPTPTSCVCSFHFKSEDFNRTFSSLPGEEKHFVQCQFLKSDDIGIIPFPSIYQKEEEKEPSARSRRAVYRKV